MTSPVTRLLSFVKVHPFPHLLWARRHTLVVLCAVLALLFSSLPAFAASDDELRADLEAAQEQKEGLYGDLQEATERVDELEAKLAVLQDRADALSAEVAALERRSNAALGRMRLRAIQAYKGQASDNFVFLSGADALASLNDRTHYMSALTQSDAETSETASALATITAARRKDLALVNEELDGVLADATAARADLTRQFAEAGQVTEDLSAELARREEEARRLAAEAAAKRAAAKTAAEEAAAAEAERRAAAASRSAEEVREEVVEEAEESRPPAASNGMVCPQAQPRSFTDTWGAPRSGGRTHEGTDIFGAYGGNVYAITSGTIEWTDTGASAGLWLSLRGNDGHQYWYMHLSGFVAGEGQSVSAGDLIAYNGDTGNAQGTSPHIHFEYHPGGGGPINPYPLLASIC